MKTVVFLLSGRVDTIVSEMELGLRPGEAVVVRCAADTTFEQILGEMMVGFGLVTDVKEPTGLSAVAMIRALRSFLATLPSGSLRPVLVLDNAGPLARGIVDRLRYLAPADATALTSAVSRPAAAAMNREEEKPDSAAGGGTREQQIATPDVTVTDRQETGRPVRVQWMVAAAVVVIVTALLVPYRSTRTANHNAATTREPAARAEALPVEMALESSPGFLVRVATFETSIRASEIARELESGGVPAFVDSSAPSTHAVLAGPYASAAEAASALDLVKRSFSDASVVAVR